MTAEYASSPGIGDGRILYSEPVNPDSSTKNGGSEPVNEPVNEPLKRKSTLKKGNNGPLNEPIKQRKASKRHGREPVNEVVDEAVNEVVNEVENRVLAAISKHPGMRGCSSRLIQTSIQQPAPLQELFHLIQDHGIGILQGIGYRLPLDAQRFINNNVVIGNRCGQRWQ